MGIGCWQHSRPRQGHVGEVNHHGAPELMWSHKEKEGHKIIMYNLNNTLCSIIDLLRN